MENIWTRGLRWKKGMIDVRLAVEERLGIGSGSVQSASWLDPALSGTYSKEMEDARLEREDARG